MQLDEELIAECDRPLGFTSAQATGSNELTN